jgi:hypothetical protein
VVELEEETRIDCTHDWTIELSSCAGTARKIVAESPASDMRLSQVGFTLLA